MQNLTVKIKVVIFGVISDALVVYVTAGSLPSEHLSKQIPLDKQVDDLFFTTIGSRLGDHYSEQLYTVSTDTSEITIVYYVLIPLERNQKYEAGWTKVSSIPKNASDNTILAYAVQRLQWKIEYTNVVYSLLPKEFTLTELQKTYEAILGQTLDKRNFRKKILSLHFLEPIGKKRVGVSRPAQMYTFKKRSPTVVKVFS